MCNLRNLFKKKKKPVVQNSGSLPWKNKDWDRFLRDAIIDFGENLLKIVPRDFENFIEKYPKTVDGRILFWSRIFVEMARFESSFQPMQKYTENFRDNSGNLIVSRGLFQLSYESCKGYNCPINSPEDLHKPKINIISAVMIMNKWVGKDLVIAARPFGTWRGGARYWSVLRGTRTYTAKALAAIRAANKID